MKKTLIAIILFVVYTCLYAFDFSGSWVLNRFSYNDKDKSYIDRSWGESIEPKNAVSFSIEEDGEGSSIHFSGFGRYRIKEIIKKDKLYEIVFYLDEEKNYRRLVIKKLNEYEICVVSTDGTTFLPSGNGNRYFRITGPNTVKKIETPLIGIIKEKATISWNSTILGRINPGESVEIIGVSNQDDHNCSFSEKYLFVKVADKLLTEYNNDFYTSQGLIKTDFVTYGFIKGKFIELEQYRDIQ